MSRANSIANDPSLAGLSGVMGLSRQPLTPQQQMQALKRVQAQAEQRVKLGMQLFKAAEARLSGQVDVLEQIKTLQTQLKEQVNNDVAQTLQQYDQWLGQIDESFTTAIRTLEEKIDAVQANVTRSEAQMRHMLDRAEALLDQSRQMLQDAGVKPTGSTMDPSAVTKSAPGASPTDSAPVEPPAAGNAATPLTFSTPVPPEVDPEVGPEVGPEASPDAPAKINHTGPPAHGTTEDEKIYSKLLQRLIEDNKSAEADRADTDKPDTPPDNRADAA